ncbi:MAG: RNA polymerase sigma factor [Acetobacteraceae bacterium]
MDEIRSLMSKVRRILRRRGRSLDEADDLIQEAFLRLQVYCRDHEVRNTGGFLLRTALNLALDRARRARVASVVPQSVEDLHLVDPSPPPDEVYAARERLLRMKAGLEAMSPRRREVFILNRIEGYSFPQIAKRLGITVSAVEKHAAKAILFLTDWMDEAKREDEEWDEHS